MRTFLFDTSFKLRDEHGVRYDWTPCREAALEEPQSEGLVVDRVNDTLYVAFETDRSLQAAARVSFTTLVLSDRGQRISLIEPVSLSVRHITRCPDDDEFECEYDAAGSAVAAVISWRLGSDGERRALP